MPITIDLEANKRIVAIRFIDPVTVEEINDFLSQLHGLQLRTPYPLLTLVDLSTVRQVPKNVLRINNHSFYRTEHAKRSHNAIIVTNTFIRVLADVITRLVNNQQYLICSTEAEARDYLDNIIAANPVDVDRPDETA